MNLTINDNGIQVLSF